MSGHTVPAEHVTLRMWFAAFMFTVWPIGFGIWGLWGMTVGPIVKWHDAKDWVPTPCYIEEHWVEYVHMEDDSDSYSQQHFGYTYTYEGQEYRASGWHIMGILDEGGSPFDRQNLYPEKTEQTCYVNPELPSQAVLDRSWDWNILGGFLPLIMLLFGLFCLYMFVFMTGGRSISSPGRKSKWKPSHPQPGRVLKQHQSALRKSLPWFAFGLIVMGMPGFFLGYYLTQEMPTEEVWAMGLLGAFIAFFALLMFGKGARLLLEGIQLRPTIRLEPDTLYLGTTGQISWSFKRRHNRLRHFQIWFEGREEVEFYENKNTVFLNSTFEKLHVLNTDSPDDAHEGVAQFTVPERTMHSFDSGAGNSIVWYVVVWMVVDKRPDSLDEYRVLVLPRPLPGETGR